MCIPRDGVSFYPNFVEPKFSSRGNRRQAGSVVSLLFFKPKLKHMIRQFFVSTLLIGLSAFQALAGESIVRVSQALSQQKAFAGGTFVVKIKIERRNLDSYFQIQQDLPAGMEAVGMESQGAVFTFKDGKVKYTWLRLPANEEIQVMYKIRVPFEMRGQQKIEGNYYYIRNEEKEIYPMSASTVEIVEYQAPSDSLAEKSILGVVNNENIPSYLTEEKTDLNFKVQILSSTRKLDRDSIRKEFGVKESVDEENFNGLYKYTIGSFKTYEQARDYKNRLSLQKYIPFVIAYNRGARITVGEAMQLAAKRKTVVKN